MTEQQHEHDRRDEDAVTPPVADASTPGNDGGAGPEHEPALAQGEKFTPEKLGDAAIKFATETVYAAAGLANVVAEKAKEFYDSQRKQIAENTPEGVDPNFRQFVDSMPDQFKTFMDDATKAFHDLSERGRTTMGDFQEQVQSAWKQWEDQQREQRAAADEKTGAFDLRDAAEATSDAASAVAPEEPVIPAPAADAAAEEYPGEGKGDVRND